MPIYEYQCNNCKHHFEKLQRMSDDVLKTCPECKQNELRKLISSSGFQLKGAGWYVTDFKGDKKPSSNSENKSKKDSATKVSDKTNTNKKS